MARILVVDDDRTTADALATLLRDDGHTVSSTTSAPSAVELLSRVPFDAVIADLEMRGTDGVAMVRAARRSLPRACIVVATARAGQRDEELLAAGACMVADKPIDYEGVCAAITECQQSMEHGASCPRAAARGAHVPDWCHHAAAWSAAHPGLRGAHSMPR